MHHQEFLQQFSRHSPRILRRQLILQLAELYLSGEKTEEDKDSCCQPSIQRFNGAVLFVDISGFTALSLRLNVEELKNHINDYFTKMLDIVDKHNGDVVKFAGDALFIIWECYKPHGMGEESDFTKSAVEKAVECGKEINESCSNHKIVISKATSSSLRDSNSFPDLNSISSNTESFSTQTSSAQLSPIKRPSPVEEEEVAFLNVHSGVSVGLMAGIDIGVENRWEYFLVGEPLSRVAEAESQASSGDLILCPETHALLHPNQKAHFGIVSAMRNLFHRESQTSKKKDVVMPCGCMSLKDGYCRLMTSTTSGGERKKQNRRSKGHSPANEDHSSPVLDEIKSDIKEAFKFHQTRFMKEFLKRCKTQSYSIENAEDFDCGDIAIQRAFCQWVETHLTDDIARHVHQVMRSEYTFSSLPRSGAYDRALENHFRRSLMPSNLMSTADVLEELGSHPHSVGANSVGGGGTFSPTRNLLSPISRTNSPGPSRTTSPVVDRRSIQGSPVQNRISASIAQANPSPRGSPLTLLSPLNSEPAMLGGRGQSSATNTSDGYVSDGSSLSLAQSLGSSGSESQGRNHKVSSRLTLRRRAENSLLMSSFTGGINAINAKATLAAAEIRTVTVMFVKLTMPPVELLVDNTKRVKMGGSNHFLGKSVNEKVSDQLLLDRFQSSIVVLSNALNAHGGQMRQFIVDDKGTVCIGTFGLRGAVSDDNAAAAMEAAHEITVKMQQMGLPCSIGVTVGKAYCGLVGSSSRHEYAVMGPSTNLSARLMGQAPVYGVICDGETRQRDRTHGFVGLVDVTAKGYSAPVPTFKPIFKEVEALLSVHQEVSTRVLKGLSLKLPSEDCSVNTGMLNSNAAGGNKKIIERMIGSKGSMSFRDAQNARVNLHGRSAEVAAAISFLLADLLDPVVAASVSPLNRGLFEFQQPSVFVGISGAQGIGKTALIQCIAKKVATVAKCTAICNIHVLRVRYDRLSGGTSFGAWKNIIHDMIIRIHATVKKETPRTKKAIVGLLESPRELVDAANCVLSLLPAHLKNCLPVLSHLGVIPMKAMGGLSLSPKELIKTCIELQAAIIQLYVSTTKNLVFLIMDDVHNFDDESVLLLLEVYSSAKGVAVLFSRRTSGPTSKESPTRSGTVVAQFCTAVSDAGRFHAIELKGLDKTSTLALVKDALVLSNATADDSVFDKVHEICGGNPFYAFEIAKSIAEKQNTFTDKSLLLHSVRIEEVICHRFDKLSTSAQALLKMAAVACSNGTRFSLSILNEIGDEMLLSHSHVDINAPAEWKNAMVLHSVLHNESFIGFASSSGSAKEVTVDLTVEMLLEGNYSFEFNVSLEQSIIYNLLLDDQKHAIHQSIASYYKRRREQEFAASNALHLEEAFHWESACVLNHAMVCYYEAYVGDQSVPKNSVYLDKAFAMYNAMKESTELLPDPQGISFANLQQLVEETFRNEGKSLAGEHQTSDESLKLDRVFQIFEGDSSMLETALAVMIEVCLQRIRRYENAFFTQLILEDAIQMILLTKEPFLMSSKYLANLVHISADGVCLTNSESMHFCLYDHFSHFCVRAFSVYLMNFATASAPPAEYSKKVACIGAQYLLLARSDAQTIHLIQALCMSAVIQNKLSNIQQSLALVSELRAIYVFDQHSAELIETYGTDYVIFLLARTAKFRILSNEPEKAYQLTASCVKYVSQTSNVATLTSCVFRIVDIMAFACRYIDAQLVWTKYDHVLQVTKTHKREQVPSKVLQLYSEWLSRRIAHINHPKISAMGEIRKADSSTVVIDELVDSVDHLMKTDNENAVYHYRHEVLLVFADICLLKIECAVAAGEEVEYLSKECCRYLHTVLNTATVDTRDAFNKAHCVKIATHAIKLISDSPVSQHSVLAFGPLFSSQVLLQLRTEAEAHRLNGLFESLAVLYQTFHGEQS